MINFNSQQHKIFNKIKPKDSTMQLQSVLHVLLEFTKHVTQNLTKLCLQLVAAKFNSTPSKHNYVHLQLCHSYLN